RNPAMLVLISLLVVYGLIGLGLASPFFARGALLVPAVTLGCSLLLSATGAGRPALVVSVLAGVTAAGSLLFSVLLRPPRALGTALLGLVVAYLLVMAVWPETNAFAALGPNPASGSRFYGLRNDVS